MKKTILFKTLVDVLYFFHFFGLLGVFFILPFGVVTINQVEMNVEDWSFFFWTLAVVSLVAYIIFLRGLFYLRKMARFLLSNKYFSEQIIINLKKSGTYFLFTGILSFILIFLVWISKLTEDEFKLVYDINFIIPLFLIIIGMFFIIQSKTLFLAKNMKEENELTV